MLTFISLFAGIGGFDLGFERAGMTCVAQVEIDPFCQKVLKKHWPDVPKFGDIHNVGKHNLPSADVICGGFPCQPHSTAGKRKGAEDDRDLWPEYRRIVEEIRPRWVVGENVLGIRTTILDQVLSDLENLGYTTGTLVIPACAFNAPHRRNRIFIIAHDDSSVNAAREKCTGRPQSYRCTWWDTYTGIRRMDDGVPSRMDKLRLKALGNAVVPQVAEFIARALLQVEMNTHRIKDD